MTVEGTIRGVIFVLPMDGTGRSIPEPRPWRDLLSRSVTELGLIAGEPVALYLIDVDRFKAVNDVLGYDLGDEMLHVIERRIADWAGPRGIVTRFDGAMFAAIRPGVDDLDAAIAAGERLRVLLAEPISLGDHQVSRSVSIGLAFDRLTEPTVVDLAGRADDALEAARAASGNIVRAFDAGLRAFTTYRSQIEFNLLGALRTNAFQLYFQPEVDLRTGAVVGVEALIRWQHPTLGLLGADQFVAVAEQTEVINALGEWALREACRQRAEWRAALPDLALVVRVNMSPTQLFDLETPTLVSSILREHGLPADQLCIEITESGLTRDQTRAVHVLEELRELGVTIALDDFGTGHSSLIRLKALPVDTLKIDREFVADLGSDPADTAIVDALIRLAGQFGLEVVAEGVETVASAAELMRLGCWRAQGHLLGRAAPATELWPLLEAGQVPGDVLPRGGR